MAAKLDNFQITKLGLYSLAAYAIYRPLMGTYHYLSHDWTVPHYEHEHTHAMCHFFTYQLVGLMFWMVALILLIVSNKHALNQQWAVRFLGLPTLGLFIMTLAVFGIMYKHYYTHDEVSYEATLSISNGIFILVIVLSEISWLTNALPQGARYIVNWLWLTFIFAASHAFFFYSVHEWLDALLTAVPAVLLAYGLYNLRIISKNAKIQ